MRQITSEISIQVTPERIWNVLTEFQAYPEWNPFIRRASGNPHVGERLEIFAQPPDGRGMTFRPTVLKAEPNQELRWLGHLFMPGLFDGEHFFQIQPLDDNSVRFVQGETFSGLLVPFFGGMLRSTERGFNEMNLALKARAEAA
jgi:hypothetical protein